MTIETFNHFEAGLWFIIGLGMLMAAVIKRRDSRWLKLLLIAAVAFVLFGVSDIIEAETGAWWKPLELLALKAACVLTFIWCYHKGKKLSAQNT
jgi:peptidoglycan/LPS O-acetylase OafA/YrhL